MELSTPRFAAGAREARGRGAGPLEWTAPPGFAAAVAGDLLKRTREYSAQHLGTWTAWVEPRVALMSELAVLIAGKGDRDPLVAGLAAYDGGRWQPSRRVEDLFAQVLVIPEPGHPGAADEDHKRLETATAALPNANTLLHRLIVAAVADVVERARQIRDRAAVELGAMQPDARIEALEMRAAKAEREATQALADMRRAQTSEEHQLRENGLLRAELRYTAEVYEVDDPEAYVQAVVAGAGQSEESHATDEQTGAPGEPGAALPSGIRQRSEGRFEALLYRSETHDGKQRGAGTFPTVEEAVEAREHALLLEAELKDELATETPAAA
jgi:hypothetical protein